MDGRPSIFTCSASTSLEPWVLLIDDVDAATTAHHLGARLVLQRSQRVPNLHDLVTLRDSTLLIIILDIISVPSVIPRQLGGCRGGGVVGYCGGVDSVVDGSRRSVGAGLYLV